MPKPNKLSMAGSGMAADVLKSIANSLTTVSPENCSPSPKRVSSPAGVSPVGSTSSPLNQPDEAMRLMANSLPPNNGAFGNEQPVIVVDRTACTIDYDIATENR